MQTVHNVLPHESTEGERSFLGEVDALTAGVHFFSAEHDRVARAQRPRLPALRLHLPHPRYPQFETAWPERCGADGSAVLGCFGRLRSYKRTVEFTRAFIEHAGDDDRLLVAGFPDTDTIDRELGQISDGDTRVDYRPGFHSDDDFLRVFRAVDWVALPYRHVFSSGVLVNALQSGRRVLCPRPVGAEAYNIAAPRALIVEPWSDALAIRRWHATARGESQIPPPAHCPLPTWEEAGRMLADFYETVISDGPLPYADDASGDRL